MNINKLTGAVAASLLCAINAVAIDNLQVSIQSSNVVLTWPGDPYQYYIVQYRPDLTSTNGWLTLTSSLPGDPTMNMTTFVHSNAVQFGSVASSGGTNGSITPGSSGSGTATNTSGSVGLGMYQVVQDGVRISDSSMFALTNGILTNCLNIAFEAGNAANDGTGTNVLGDIECAFLQIDGMKFAGDGGVLGSPTNSSLWHFSMDTAYLLNGSHTLQVGVTLQNPDNSDGNHVNITRYSDPVTITVSNTISYPNWEPEIGEAGISAYFLQTTCTNSNWQIDIYDVSNRLAQTLTGTTDDTGAIEAYWNMVDTNGVTRTNADVDPEFNAIVTVADPMKAFTPKKRQRKNNWPDHDRWTVAYQDFFKFEYSANNYMQSSINNYANTAARYGGYYLYYPQTGQTNDVGQTYPMRYQKENHPDPSITSTATFLDEQLLRRYLSDTNSRNFFFDGHGDPHSIAGIDPVLLKVSVQHRYRFVMLDACSTANGDLDEVFGIHGPGKFALTYYHNTGIRPGAFCGYDKDVIYATGGQVTYNGVTYDDTIPDDVPFFIYNFLFYWDANLEGERLQDAISNAADNLPNPGGPDYREYHWQIYGYDDLRIDECNHKTDTW